jgi:4-deoxy-L-threo-5-hexosulose-uronate ketol-isomerase
MQIRQPVHSEHARTLDTTGLRRHFLVEQLFVPEQATLTYSQIDRIIVGGIHPVLQTVRFASELGKHTGTDFFLQRRELGLINIGGAALVEADGHRYEVGPREALYIGQGARELSFSSVDPAQPAKLYFNCAPATRRTPIAHATKTEAEPRSGSIATNTTGSPTMKSD